MSSVTGHAHGIGAAHVSDRSAPVYTARTPGTAAAAEVSIDVMRAWAYGLRRTAMYSAPGIFMSLVKTDSPVSSAGSSLRSRRVPSTLVVESSVTVIAGPPSSCRASCRSGCRSGGAVPRGAPVTWLFGSGVRRRSGEHGLDDVVVAGAPAEVALEAEADVVLGRVRVLLEQAGGRHHHARRAVAALETVVLHEGLLHRVQRSVSGGHAFDGAHLLAVGLDGQHGATLHRLAVEVDGAGAARRRVAADVGSGEPDVFADVLHQQGARLHVVRVLGAVDRDGDLH